MAKHMTVKEKAGGAYEKMKTNFHYKNLMATPKLKKIVVNVGTGTMMKKDKNKNEAREKIVVDEESEDERSDEEMVEDDLEDDSMIFAEKSELFSQMLQEIQIRYPAK